jgi:hypothetical protein
MKRLQAEGMSCAAIDISEISNRHLTLEQWYAGIAYLLISGFNLLEPVKNGYGGLSQIPGRSESNE